MRAKKRYILLKTLPEDLPAGTKFLFQSERGFVVKTTLQGAEQLRKEAVLISGSIRNLKETSSSKN